MDSPKEELNAAKAAYLKAHPVPPSQDLLLLNMLAAHELQNRTMKWEEAIAQIQTLSVIEVNAAFRKHVDPAGLTIVKAADFQRFKAFQ